MTTCCSVLPSDLTGGAHRDEAEVVALRWAACELGVRRSVPQSRPSASTPSWSLMASPSRHSRDVAARRSSPPWPWCGRECRVRRRCRRGSRPAGTGRRRPGTQGSAGSRFPRLKHGTRAMAQPGSDPQRAGGAGGVTGAPAAAARAAGAGGRVRMSSTVTGPSRPAAQRRPTPRLPATRERSRAIGAEHPGAVRRADRPVVGEDDQDPDLAARARSPPRARGGTRVLPSRKASVMPAMYVARRPASHRVIRRGPARSLRWSASGAVGCVGPRARVVRLGRAVLLRGRALERVRHGSTFSSLSRLSRSSRAVVSSFCGQIWSKAAFRAAPISTAMESR